MRLKRLDPVRRRKARAMLIAAPLAAGVLAFGLLAHSGPASDKLSGQLETQAGRGEFDGNAAYDALLKSGMSEAEAGAKVDELRETAARYHSDKINKENEEAARRREAETKKAAGEQNASGSGDWNFGAVYRDRDYNVTYPLTNNCKLPQTITISYPKAFPLSGPASVTVPAKATVNVAMSLKNSSLPKLPQPPYPPGVSLDCYDLSDEIVLTHPEAKKVTFTPAGKLTWICHEMERKHQISMHMHLHAPVAADAGGGGGGARKRQACTVYWNYGEFYPSPEARSPEDCREDIQAQAVQFFDKQLSGLKSRSPLAWSWVPTAADIAKLRAVELVALKARADAQAKGA